MRRLILSLPSRAQPFIIVCSTIVSAFLAAYIASLFFDTHQLQANTDLTSAVFQVLGTIYAILLTFTLWGVWQNFTEAGDSVKNEAYALLDLVHIIESSNDLNQVDIRKAAHDYSQLVVEKEWPTLRFISHDLLTSHETSYEASQNIIKVVQEIYPKNPREVTIFSQTITTMNRWLDARRTRILKAQGNSAKALWPLLLPGACILFAFNGLFVAKTLGIWITLLFGLSLLIGLAFYLIFTLDCPFDGSLSVDAEPFKFVGTCLEKK